MDGEIRTEASDAPDVGTREAFEALKADASPPRRSPRAERPRWQAIAKFLVLFGIGAGIVTWGLTSSESPFVYSVMVTEVAANPASFEGRTLRMEGARSATARSSSARIRASTASCSRRPRAPSSAR
jgi:hypothetical protein